MRRVKTTYSCTLAAPVWTRSGPRTDPPSLCFWQGDRLAAEVSVRADDLRDRDRWVLSHYPASGFLPAAREDGYMTHGYLYRKPRRLEPLLERGEQRFPRDTAAAAVRLALEKLSEDGIPKEDIAAMEKVAAALRQALERLAGAYTTHFRPAAA